MITVACVFCQNEFLICPTKYRKNPERCCSHSCSSKRKHRLGLINVPKIEKSITDLIQHEYEQSTKTMTAIGVKFNCSRAKIHQLARRYGWIKFIRKSHIRAAYRKSAELKIGRKLNKGEHVHHIDGAINNNLETNLHVFENAKKHSECHDSLERVAFELYRQGVISFNHELGVYRLTRS